MSQPQSMDEYNARFAANSEITGYGLEVTQHLPCPFCAAPRFQALKPYDLAMNDRLRMEATCSECGRSGRFNFSREDHGSSIEFVQTGGEDPPAWLSPAPRRDAA